MGSLKLFDTVQFKLLDPNLIKVKDDYPGAFKPDLQGQQHPSGMGMMPSLQQQQSAQPTSQGLQVRISATHSGLITRNNGFYLPDRMKKGAHSFTDNYGKPVLLHHNDHQDPVGRIVQAVYRDTSGSVIDRYRDYVVKDRKGKDRGVITETLIEDLVSGKMPFGMQVDTICTMLRDSLLEEPSYEGLGYIELVANITDISAIEKLLDGRYLTGSVGATTDAAVCSVCRQDWTQGGPCEHSPGGIYDGVKCFVIAGSLIYDEYSFVNVPADRHSRVLELNYNGVQDSVKTEDKFHGKLYETNLGFPQYDQETRMLDKSGKVSLVDSVSGETVTDEAVIEQPETAPVVTDTNPAPEVVSVLDKLLSNEVLSTEEQDALYDMVFAEIVAAVNDGTLIMDTKELEDTKLSSEKRSKLPKSTFCGSSRSFPVPDCAHVTAARRLINRVEAASEVKDKISTCIDRKAKAMGCKSADKVADKVVTDSVSTDIPVTEVIVIDTTVQAVKLTDQLLATLDKTEFVFSAEDNETLATILKLLAERIGKDAFVSVLKQTQLADNLIQEAEQELLNEIAKHEEELGELKERLEANRKEYTSLSQDFEGLQDSLVEEKLKTRKILESHLSTLKTLRDQKVEQSDYSTLSDSALQVELDQVMKVVDMTKITDKLGDGMSRVPVGEVTLPTAIQDNVTNTQKSQFAREDLERIRDQYVTLLFSRGSLVAETFRRQMIAEGKLPQD